MELLKEYSEIVYAAIAGIIGWFAGKRRNDAEIRALEGDALTTIQAVYDKFAADTKSRIEELVHEITGLTTEVKELRTTVSVLEQDLEDCRKGISRMNKQSTPKA
jgi:phage shock protein A